MIQEQSRTVVSNNPYVPKVNVGLSEHDEESASDKLLKTTNKVGNGLINILAILLMQNLL